MPTSFDKKLNLIPEMILEVINSPVEWAKNWETELPADRIVFTLSKNPAARLVFVNNKEQIEKLVIPLLPSLPAKCIFWLAYPKGTSGRITDINRDIIWKLLEPEGWRPVRMVALDEVWACMRIRPIEAVKS
jgi:hypothetical protein